MSTDRSGSGRVAKIKEFIIVLYFRKLSVYGLVYVYKYNTSEHNLYTCVVVGKASAQSLEQSICSYFRKGRDTLKDTVVEREEGKELRRAEGVGRRIIMELATLVV